MKIFDEMAKDCPAHRRDGTCLWQPDNYRNDCDERECPIWHFVKQMQNPKPVRYASMIKPVGNKPVRIPGI